MLAHDRIVFGPDAQADVLVHDARHHGHQHGRILDVLGIGGHRAGQGVLLLAARLVGLIEDVLEFGIVLEHARVEMLGQRYAVRLQDGGRGLDQLAGLGAQHLLLLVMRSCSLLNIYLIHL
ncbi:hypothetical protein D3C72_1283680 [compost metagenome]